MVELPRRLIMRVKILHITDHAILRWGERGTGITTVENITQAIKSSKVISKKEHLPFSVPRKKNTTYAFNGVVLFVLEPIEIEEYKLITLFSEVMLHNNVNVRIPKSTRRKKSYELVVTD